MIGLVLASMFATTMSMTSSDANTISAVITRDILPTLSKKVKFLDNSNSLKIGRRVTFLFTLGTIIIALQYESFGGVLGLIVAWFGALIGPISIPMLLGMLPMFKHCGPRSAIGAILSGFLTFIVIKSFSIVLPFSVEVSLPLMVSFVSYLFFGILNRGKEVSPEVVDMFQSLDKRDTA